MNDHGPERPTSPGEGSAMPVFVLFALLGAVLFALFAGNAAVRVSQPDPASSAAETPAQMVQAATVGSLPPTLEAAVPDDALHSQYTDEQIAAGQRVYDSLCFACHAADGTGITGLGKTLIGSAFIDGLSDDELLTFLIVGRSATDPLNTSGQAMPARGGNPMLTDEDLMNVVAYIRDLNAGEAVVAAPEAAAPESSPLPEVRAFVPLPINAIDASVIQPYGGASGGLDLPPLGDLDAVNARWLGGGDLRAALLAVYPDIQDVDGFIAAFGDGYPALDDAQIETLLAYIRGG